jgi:hypothetical protein
MPTRYIFNAHAVGLAGHITLPFDHLIESQAPSALIAAGGFSTARVRNFSYKNIVSFSSCQTRVTGTYSERENAFFTEVEAVVEDLNILGILQVERLSSRIMIRHAAKAVDANQRDQAPEPLYEEPIIVPTGTSIDGLRLAGAAINVILDMRKFTDFPTLSALRKNCSEDFRRKRFMGNPNDQKGPIFTSLVDRLEVGGEELDQEKARSLGLRVEEDGAINVDQFGKVRVAPFVADADSRSITGLEVELGCAIEGKLSAGGGEGHGTPMPPPAT